MCGKHRKIFVLVITLSAMAANVVSKTASAQSAWKGAGGTAANPKTGMWNANANWDPAGVPASGNTTALSFSSGVGNAAYTATDNIGGTFDLHSLTLANNSGNADALEGNPLRFLSAAGEFPSIQQNGANLFTIRNNLQLGDIPTLGGSGAGEVQITGVISNSPAVTPRGLTVNMTGTGSYFLGGNNTYTGSTTLQAGSLVIGSNTALGTGELFISGGTIGSGPTVDRTLGNNVSISGDFQAGSMGINSSLTFSGTTTLTSPFFGGRINTITIPNPDSRLVFGGPVVSSPPGGFNVGTGISLRGATAGGFTSATGRLKLGGVL